MKLVIGSDHVGIDMKKQFVSWLESHGHEVEDVGPYTCDRVHYPDYGFKVAKAVSESEYDRGILICGTGVGMSLAANKVDGIRAVVCTEPYSALMSRAHNDANVLCLGARVIGSELAEMILKTWMTTEFEGGRHQTRVDMINNYAK